MNKLAKRLTWIAAGAAVGVAVAKLSKKRGARSADPQGLRHRDRKSVV